MHNTDEKPVIDLTTVFQKSPITVLSYEKAKHEDTFKDIVNHKKIKAFFNSDVTSLKLISKEGDLSFQIDTSIVKKATKEHYISYTFLLKRENTPSSSHSFENLLIEKKHSTIQAYLIRYEPDATFLSGTQNEFSGDISVETIAYDASSFFNQTNRQCLLVDIYMLRDCTVHGPSGIYNRECDNYGLSEYIITTEMHCFDDNGGGDLDGGDPNVDNPDGGGDPDGDNLDGGGSGTGPSGGGGGDSTTGTVYPCNDEIHGCNRIANIISSNLSLNESERLWLSMQDELYILGIEAFLLENNSIEAENFVKGQIELETLTQNIPWVPNTGTIANSKYTHTYFDGSRGYFKLEDGSIVVSSSSEQTLTSSGDLRDKYNEVNPNDKYYYIKLPGQQWAEMLFNPDSLSEGLKNLFKLAAIDLGQSLGRYVLPIEDIKILIDGKDFEGQEASRLNAAGFLLLAVIPGSKALKIVGNVADATVVAVKLGSNTLVVDTVKTGLKIVTDSHIIKFLSQAGDEIARVVNGIMTFKYIGFGGDVITNSDKTTTLIGKWANQIENIWNTGLAKQGANKGGINILGEAIGNTIEEIWANNRIWLDDAIARGDDIRVTANPLDINNVFNVIDDVDIDAFSNISNLRAYLLNLDPTLVNDLGYYGREIRYLFQNGYNFNSVTNKFIR